MHSVLAPRAVSITEFRTNPSAHMKAAEGESLAVLVHGRPRAYVVPAEAFEALVLARRLEQQAVQA